MMELFVGTDLARRKVAAPFETAPPAKRPAARARRAPVRSKSAKALRSLADRLEPSFGG